jgi:hypothetical protein
MLKMLAGPIYVIADKRTTRASTIVVRPEHEVVDNELTVPIEQFGKAHRPIRTFEDIILLNLCPRKLAASGAHGVTGLRELLLLLEEGASGVDPFAAGYNFVLYGCLGAHLNSPIDLDFAFRPEGRAQRRVPADGRF